MSESASQDLHALVATVLSCDGTTLSDDDGPHTLKGWDSVAQILLVGAVEEAFGAVFTNEEIISIASIGDIRSILVRHGVKF